MLISSLRAGRVGVTQKTDWVHVFVTDEHGHVGVGEATLDLLESPVMSVVEQLAAKLVGREVGSVTDPIVEFGLADAFSGLVQAAALSGIEQALWDLLGRCHGVPVHVMLGAPRPTPLRVYANLNRALLRDRSPAAYADIASRAVEAGYTAVKVAPFDGVLRARLEDRQVRQVVEAGLERVAAVRRVIGADIDLMVDCHYRFTARSGTQVLEKLGEYDPYWVEAPVAENRLAEWGEIRSRTSLQLAGGEMMTGLPRFAEFIDATGVDVIMPDVKYIGGISGVRAVAALAASRGIVVAPHNPSGPVATLATVHASSGLSNVIITEHAFGECDWRTSLVSKAECLTDGRIGVPQGPGFGFEFDETVAAAHPPLATGPHDARVRQ